jgi:hypothetical protein
VREKKNVVRCCESFVRLLPLRKRDMEYFGINVVFHEKLVEGTRFDSIMRHLSRFFRTIRLLHLSSGLEGLISYTKPSLKRRVQQNYERIISLVDFYLNTFYSISIRFGHFLELLMDLVV